MAHMTDVPGTQRHQRPEAPTVTVTQYLAGMRVNIRYTNFTKFTSSLKNLIAPIGDINGGDKQFCARAHARTHAHAYTHIIYTCTDVRVLQKEGHCNGYTMRRPLMHDIAQAWLHDLLPENRSNPNYGKAVLFYNYECEIKITLILLAGHCWLLLAL